jgi:3-carboxy-cis,cis-muconate cycloisomerase
MSGRLIECLATTPALAALFSDESVLQAMLEFEAALARAEARHGIIPPQAANAIAAAAVPANFNISALADASFRAGTPAIPLVKMLTDQLRKTDPDAARFVHWGATSQDVADTAMSLLLMRAKPILIGDLSRLEKALANLSENHKDTVMLGRTLLQPAPPVTFGLKAAGWLASVRRGRQRLQKAFRGAVVLQFGGASGTLASLGDRGIPVAQTLSAKLGFPNSPPTPWHTQRDQLAALICACGVLTGSLGKMARDISLLMQQEVAEASEPGGEGRGGSSTMPNKRNPIACSLSLAAAHRVPGLVASFLSAMVQEHERGVGGWQAEWPIVASVVQSTGVAAASMAEAAKGLTVDARKMRLNLENTNGTIFAERAMMLLATKLGRDVAHKILEAAVRKSIAEGKHLAAVLAETPELETHLSRATLTELEIPEQYLGSAETFRNALAAEPDRRNNDYEDNDCEDEDCEDEDRKDVDPQNNDPRDNN